MSIILNIVFLRGSMPVLVKASLYHTIKIGMITGSKARVSTCEVKNNIGFFAKWSRIQRIQDYDKSLKHELESV